MGPSHDHLGMDCDSARTALSARIDGEDPGVAADAVDDHLAGCAACRAWEVDAQVLHRRLRVRAAGDVPDLAPAILAAAPANLRPLPRRDGARYALLAVALTQLALAVPALVLGDQRGASIHLAREMGSWDVALGLAWLLVAFQPRRASGLLAFTAVLAGALFATSAIDVATGVTQVVDEIPHLLDLAGVALLWVLARSAPITSPLLPPLRPGRARH